MSAYLCETCGLGHISQLIQKLGSGNLRQMKSTQDPPTYFVGKGIGVLDAGVSLYDQIVYRALMIG